MLKHTTSRTRLLIGLNAGLAALALAAALAGAQAAGQPGTGRARGEYTMVSGATSAGGPQAIFVVDSANQEFLALRWNQGRQSLDTIGYRSIATDAAAKPGR
jgi:hypothetical protein